MSAQGIGISNTYGQIETDKTGRTKIASLIDGLDPSSIPKQKIDIAMQQSQIYEDKISINSDKKIPAIEELREKVSALDISIKKLTNDLRANYLGSNFNNSNALSDKIARPSQSDGSFTLVVDPVATVSKTEFKISVSQKAKTDTITCTYNFPSLNEPVNFSGTLVINKQIITITDASTLSTIINDINSKADNSNVKATSLKISDTAGYRLTLESKNIGEPINFMGAGGTDATLTGENGLKLPATNTDPETITNSMDQIQSGYTNTDPKTTQVGFTGNLVINGQAIPITNTSTLNSIMKSINNVSNKSNVKASVESSDGTNFGLVLKGTQLGVPINLLSLTTSNSLQGSEGLQLPTTNTDPSTIRTATDHVVSTYIAPDVTTALNFNGTLLINNQQINIENTFSLNDIRDAINKSTKAANVIASIVSSDDENGFQLVLDGTEVGVPIDFLGTTTSSNLRGTSNLSIPQTNTDSDSLIAKLSVNGTDIERKCNIISDIIAGVTLTVEKTSVLAGVPTGGTTFSIDNDKKKTYEAIKEFVENYNAVIDALYIHKKTTNTAQTNARPEPHPDALLYDDNIIYDTTSLLKNIMDLAIVGETNKDYTSLVDIGITLSPLKEERKENYGKLVIDDNVLKKTILDGDFEKIIKLFGNYGESNTPDFYIYSMPKKFDDKIAGKPINLTYTYNEATSTDDRFSENFSVLKPTKPLGPVAAGQLVTLTYSQDNDGVYSATVKGTNTKDNTVTMASAKIENNTLTFPSGSIYDGLVINYTNTESLTPGSSIETTLTLPYFSAMLSMAGQEPVTISNVQGSVIKGPEGSLYEGLDVGCNIPLVLGDSSKTTLTLTQGIAVNFDVLLKNALSKDTVITDENGKQISIVTGLFDLAIQKLQQQNTTNQQQINDLMQSAERVNKSYELRMNDLYMASYKTKSISQMLEAELASHYD